MNLKIKIPEDTPSKSSLSKPSLRSSTNNKPSPSDLTSSAVLEKLSSTRHLLEKTLHKQKKPQSIPPTDPELNLHHQLKKPGFEELNQIYSNYKRVPNIEKLEFKQTIPNRSSSAPPVFQKTREQLIQEKEEKFKQECTFKPTINTLKPIKNLDYVGKKFDRNEWFKNLTKPKNEAVEKRERQKREKEEEDTRNCSFRPSISSFRSASSGRLRIEERLFPSENKAAKREQQKREKEDREAASFPFTPQVTQSTSVLTDERKSKVPLFKRITQVQQEKTQLRILEREKQEKAENLTFKPFISPKSQLLASQKCLGSVVDRLSQNTSQMKDRFSETSISVMSNPSRSIDPQDFLERQQEFLEKSRKAKEELASKSIMDLKFKPDINQNSNLIAYYKHNYSQESLENKLQRIGRDAQAKKTQLQAKIQQDYYSKFNFEPQLNPLSRQLAKAVSIESYSEDTKTKKKAQAQASLAEIEKICSFSPKINSVGRFQGKSRYKQGENILKAIKDQQDQKKKTAISAKKEEEIEKLSLCTFKPNSLSRIRSSGDVLVKGTDRFLELRNMAKKQQLEKELREKQVLYKDMSRDLGYGSYY